MGRLNRKLNLNVLSEDETTQIRESHLSQSMSGMKSAIRNLNVETNIERISPEQQDATPHYQGTELAEVAREVYRENINPVKVEYQDEGPDTHARRVEKRSIQRALMGLRNGGDEGKTSMVGPNGSGNVGKYSPSAEAGDGNATNNTDNYYALTTDMTLEEYQDHIDNKLNEALGTIAGIAGGAALGNLAGGAAGAALPTSKGILGLMGGKAAGVGAGKALGSVGGAVAGGVAGNQLDKKEKKEVKEDAVKDLKLILMQMEDTSWQEIDKVMRQVAKDNYMTPKELHKEFKAQHDGMIPDEWIKENREIEMAGFIPLQELARLNPVGVIYTVTYMYRGGTQRRKFLVPHMEPPTREEMEEYVRGFWPFARVLAYYPDAIDNQQNNNSMVAVPPITEKYYFYQEEDWVTLDEDLVEIYNTICEEEGEPLSSPEQQLDGTYLLLVSDHDTGEHKYITFGESKDDPGDERKLTKMGAERQNAVSKLMSNPDMQKRMDDAIAKSVARDKERGRVPGLPEPFKLKKREEQKEEFELEEEKDKKGKGSGKKDACYSKVKSRYSVWPSAYASGALVKCRQKGAKNWGNSKKD